jgi:hypothetical protein
VKKFLGLDYHLVNLYTISLVALLIAIFAYCGVH